MSSHDVLPAARAPQDAERTPARARANGDQDRKDFRDWVEKDGHPPYPASAHLQVAEVPTTPAARAAFRAVADHAVEASVLYEWQATPGYALSQLSRPRGLAPMPVSLQAAEQIAARAESATFCAPLQALPAAPNALPEAAALFAAFAGAVLTGAAHPTDAALSMSAAADRAVLVSAAERWSDRSIKRVLDAEGTVTIWVRDYRMSGSDTKALVGALLSETANSATHRIMFNGAEVWRRPTTRQGDGSGN
ncbi:hypothetical protein AB8810_20380 [Xanthomonas sp. NCPPB 3005]|uniref:hypothetical protein n=1 Tax=Xanthomonas sp. NCPPB 3005 TaxID=3240913 RepID=UPI003511460A